MTYSSYELKYCERCGGLGLRRSQSGLPYCCDCQQMLQRFLVRPPSADDKAGQLRRIVHRLRRRVPVRPIDATGAQGAVHAF
jgi:hypothetical protein